MIRNAVPGARWWKVDFHAHSPNSFDYGGLEEGKAAESTVTVREWLLTYMKAGIDAIVVADHNSHAGIGPARAAFEELRAEAAEGFREVAIFAGSELTVDGNYHLLAVFDVDTDPEVVNGLLHKVEYQGERGTSDSTTSTTFQQAIDEVLARGGLAIPAHADRTAGLFKHNPPNVKAIVEDGKIHAAEVTTDEGAAQATKAGWVPVLGSDAHHLDGSLCPPEETAKYPGSHFTWVKMSEPSLAGLRVAFSDGADSVIRATKDAVNPNLYVHSVLEKVIVKSNGVACEYEFSPWMNALIGGRGSGKSTLVELVRLALGRFDDLPGPLREDMAWFSPAPAEDRVWDESTEIELQYTRSDQRYRVTWKGSKPGVSEVSVWDGSSWEHQDGDAAERFPVLLNSQKQIYETAKDPQSLLSVIDSEPEVDFRGWLEEFRRLSSQYRTERAEVAELELQTSNRGRIAGEIADAQAAIDLRNKLEGSDEAKELEGLIEAQAKSDQRLDVAAVLESSLENALAAFDAHPRGELADGEWDQLVAREAAIDAAAELARESRAQLKGAREKWVAAADEAPRVQRISELRLALATGDDGEQGVEDFGDMVERRGSLGTQMDAIEAAEKTLLPAKERAAATLIAIRSHRASLTAKRKVFVAGLGDEQLKVEVHEQADDVGLEASLRELIRRPNAFDSVFDRGGVRSVLASNFRDPKHMAEVDELKALLRQLRVDGSSADGLQPRGLSFDQRFFNHLETIDESEFFTEVDLWFPDDTLNIRYKDPISGNLINLDQGSPGQKTAALLTLMLQIGNAPLVLDQPEDDLDNRLIYDLVVTRLKSIKRSRQIIVVTHNANVVVNADAEWVIVMKHGFPPEVERSGSIQDSNVKDDICWIMEGGKIAFQHRYGRLMDVA